MSVMKRGFVVIVVAMRDPFYFETCRYAEHIGMAWQGCKCDVKTDL